MKSSEPGIIILGNSGAGKSYICNILIGYERFKAEFQPEAVTTETEHHQITVGSNAFRIYNIPGLVEVNQEQIERNKREIMKAFDQSPTSVVLFVWTQIGGRAQNDDIIAFNALNEAYKFPSGSLMFVINNIPLKRPFDYEAKFLATLTNVLNPMPVAMDGTFFLDHVDLEDKEKINEAHSRLISFISHHHASLQRKHADIILQSDQLKKMRELLKEQQREAEKDREAFRNQIQKMTKEYQIAKEQEEKRFHLMQAELEGVRMNAKKERAAQAEERRKLEKQQREQYAQHQQQLAAEAEKRQKLEKQQQEQYAQHQQQLATEAEERRKLQKQQREQHAQHQQQLAAQAEERRKLEKQQREQYAHHQQQLAAEAEKRQKLEKQQLEQYAQYQQQYTQHQQQLAAQAEERRKLEKQQREQYAQHQQQLAAEAEKRQKLEKQQLEQYAQYQQQYTQHQLQLAAEAKERKQKGDISVRLATDVVAAPVSTVVGA
ncbi:unnamed protein product, partial [Didymodactylos carnosus]